METEKLGWCERRGRKTSRLSPQEAALCAVETELGFRSQQANATEVMLDILNTPPFSCTAAPNL